MVERCSFTDGENKCRTKLKLTDFACRCEKRFCQIHRMPEKHFCSFDYKACGRKIIEKSLPVIKCEKIIKI